MSFSSLGLSAPLVTAVTEQGYQTPSPIQAKAIPAVLEGRDVMAAAQTGTGKTAGFTLPILERLSRGQRARANQVRALILTPTRELAAQVGESVSTYGSHLPLRSSVVFGGVKINPQMQRLRPGVDILVATPGRLLDLFNQNAVKFKQLEILVLDEADRMLDMGFIHDIRKIIRLLPPERQNLMFSATFSDDIRKLAKGLIHNPVEISVSPRNTTAKTVEQWICPVDKKQKPALLKQLIIENKWSQVLVFSRTKHGADRLAKYLLKGGIEAAAIHGNKSQNQRTRALSGFKNGEIRILVATDIAARGLDIDQLPQVVNVDLPNVSEDYVHRIGRTGRAGATGQAVSLVSADEFKELSDIERLIGRILPRKLIDGFEPDHDVPASDLTKKVKKPKKPKAAKDHQDGQRGAGNQGKPARNRNASQPNNKPKRGENRKANKRTQDNNRNNTGGQTPSATKPNNNQRRRNRKNNGNTQQAKAS
ncbi:MAG: DEAD/DEAH box helicase [Thiolinea sp.]